MSIFDSMVRKDLFWGYLNLDLREAREPAINRDMHTHTRD